MQFRNNHTGSAIRPNHTEQTPWSPILTVPLGPSATGIRDPNRDGTASPDSTLKTRSAYYTPADEQTSRPATLSSTGLTRAGMSASGKPGRYHFAEVHLEGRHAV